MKSVSTVGILSEASNQTPDSRRVCLILQGSLQERANFPHKVCEYVHKLLRYTYCHGLCSDRYTTI